MIDTILLIQERSKDILNRYALFNEDDTYSIYSNGCHVGVVEYRESGELIYIESLYIDKEYQECGIGRNVISMLYEKFETAIAGDAVPESVGFWKSVGANFDGEEYNLDYYIENCGCVPFIIENIRR